MANEKRLIDANALLEKIQYRLPFKDRVSEMINEIVEITRKQIAEAPTVDVAEMKWIPVSERLPKPFTPVLVYRKSFGTLPPYIKVDKMILWNDDTQVWTDEVGNWKNVTTNWMPLPQPPKGE